MKKLFLFFTLILFSNVLYSQNIDEIMTNAVKAMNKQALDNIQTFIITGSQFVAAQGEQIPITYKLKRPDKVRIEIEYMGNTIIQSYDGKKAWMVNPLTGSKDKRNLPDNAKDQFLQIFDLLTSPLSKYGEEGYKFEYDGKESINDNNYIKVKMTDKENDVITIYIDEITNWFYKFSTVMEKDGEKNTLEYVFEEKTKVGGTIVPTVIEIKINGETQMAYNFDEYEINVELDDKIFEKP
jgi:outer membrane lipoprotein-sorting protein